MKPHVLRISKIFLLIVLIGNNFTSANVSILNKEKTYENKMPIKIKHNKKLFLFYTNLINCKKQWRLYMTKKFKYKYKNTLERRKKKGAIKNSIYQKLRKKNSAYITIIEKLSKLDPDQNYFKYDKDILKEYENIKNIYKNKKLKRKFNYFDFWYSSKKKEAKYNYSRHVNYAITENKFNFKNIFSYFHILEIVHEKFKNNPFYINGLQSFLNKYYDPVTKKRIKSWDKLKIEYEIRKAKRAEKNIKEKSDMKKKEENDKEHESTRSDVLQKENIEIMEEKENRKMEEEREQKMEEEREQKMEEEREQKMEEEREQKMEEEREQKMEEEREQKMEEEREQENIIDTTIVKREGEKKEIETKEEFFEIIKNNLRQFYYSNEVSNDFSFKLFGSPSSCYLKKNSPISYDIKNPFMKSKLSSKRRRLKEKKLFDIINFKCKNRKERLMLNAVRKSAKRKMKGQNYILDSIKTT